MEKELSAPQFKQFERVAVTGEGPECEGYRGEHGTVLWLDSFYVRKDLAQGEKWMYIVHLPARDSYRTFLQSHLRSDGTFDQESAHLGVRPEISFDVVLDEDNEWVEGSYRLPGKFWQVVIFQRDDVSQVRHKPSSWSRQTKWERDISGTVFRIPKQAKVDRNFLLRAMTNAFGYDEWTVVSGPDSMVLR